MPDTTKDDWLQAAAFLYPVVPPPVISSWAQLEVLLKVASRFDIQLLLHKSEEYITSNANTLVADPKSEQFIWRWVQLADKSGLQQCLSALADRATFIDRAGCSNVANLAGLTQHALQQLVVSCAGRPGRPALGDTSDMHCYNCSYSSTRTHKLAWTCGSCRRVNTSNS